MTTENLPSDKIKGTTTQIYYHSRFPVLLQTYLLLKLVMSWYNNIGNWARNFKKYISCDRSRTMMNEPSGPYLMSALEHGHSDTTFTNSSRTRTQEISRDRHTPPEHRNYEVHDERSIKPEGQDCHNDIPEELMRSINNINLKLPNTYPDQASGPSHSNNIDIDYRVSPTCPNDTDLYYPPRNWLPKLQITLHRKVYSNKNRYPNSEYESESSTSNNKRDLGKRHTSIIDLPERYSSNNDINVIVCQPPRRWVNNLDEPRLGQIQVFDSEISKENETKTTNNTSTRYYEETTPITTPILPKQVTCSTAEKYFNKNTANTGELYNYQLFLEKLEKEKTSTVALIHDNHIDEPQKIENEVEEIACSAVENYESTNSTESEDSLIHYSYIGETQQTENEVESRENISQIESDQNLNHSEVDTRLIRVPIRKKLSRNYSQQLTSNMILENHDQSFVHTPSQKRKSGDDLTKNAKRFKKTPPIKIVTEEVVGSFERNLQETELTPYERNYLKRIHDILRKCDEIEQKMDSIDGELDEQKMYYFGENLQRNMEKLDRIDPQDSVVLEEQRKNVIKIIFKIIEKLEEKTESE